MKNKGISVIQLRNLAPVSKSKQETRHRRKKLPQFIAAILANLGAISFGSVNGRPSPTLLLLRNPEKGFEGRSITLEEESWIVSITYLAAFLTAPLYSYINQAWGRKMTGYCTGISLIAAWSTIIFAYSIVGLLIARLLMGAGTCGINVFLTIYCGEIADYTVRGTLGTLRTFFASFGLISIYGCGPYVTIQQMGIISLVFPMAFLFGMFWLPESPMYLEANGREEEAYKSLLWLCGGNKEAEQDEFGKLQIVVRDFTSVSSNKASLKDIIANKGTRRALILSVFLAIIQQFSGMYVVLSFCGSIFDMAGTDMSPHTSSLIVACILLLGSLFGTFIIDVAGRRIIIICTQIAMFFTLGSLGTYFYLMKSGFDVTVLRVLPIVCLSFYVFVIVLGLPTLTYVVVAEIFNPEARDFAMMTSNAVIWFLAYLIIKFYPILLKIIESYGCFWIFAGVALLGSVYVYLQLPETKNRSIESILRELNGEPSMLKTRGDS